MTVYNGNSKIGNIYYKNQSIKEIYYGSTRVYTKGLSVRRYGYTRSGSAFSFFLFGPINTQSLLCNTFGSDDSLLVGAITGITGTLGSSGSKISININGTITSSIPYYSTSTYNGTELYIYRFSDNYIYYYIYVYTDSVVGSYACISVDEYQISTINEQTVNATISSTTVTGTRDNSYLKYWTKNGLT